MDVPALVEVVDEPGMRGLQSHQLALSTVESGIPNQPSAGDPVYRDSARSEPDRLSVTARRIRPEVHIEASVDLYEELTELDQEHAAKIER